MDEQIQEREERRFCSRTSFDAYVELWDKEHGILVSGRMTDISMFGLFAKVPDPIPVGTLCKVKISIIAKSTRLTLEDIEGTVIRYSDEGVGIAFITSIEWFALFNVYSYYGRGQGEVPHS